MPRFVLTGAPGTGKTTVMSLLSARFTTFAEPARELIAEHRAATGDATLHHQPEMFVERLVARSIDNYSAVSDGDVAFFDRGLPDCIAYATVSGVDPRPIEERAMALRYGTPIFMAPPWQDIYTKDSLRRATYEQIVIFDDHLRRAYTGLEYDVVELPKISAEERAAFIVGTLGLS